MTVTRWLPVLFLSLAACATPADKDDDDAGRDGGAVRDVGGVNDSGGGATDAGGLDATTDGGGTTDAGGDDDTSTGGDVTSDIVQDPVCGNGRVEADEECDDGNRTSGDGCEADCTLPGGADAGADTAVDTGAGDASDVGEDTTPDVGEDATPDVGEDTTPDAGEDTTPDVGEDTGSDAGSDAGSEVGASNGTCADPIAMGAAGREALPFQDELSPSCLSIDDAETVFLFTPPSAGTWCFDTRASIASDTLVSVRTTCDDVGTELGCFDDYLEPGDDGFTFNALGSVALSSTAPVYVIVDVYRADPGETIALEITEGTCGEGGGGSGDGAVDAGALACGDGADEGLIGLGEVGEVYRATCPSGCADAFGIVYGTDIYSDDSSICRAAVHARAITDDVGGDVLVTIEDGQETYAGSDRNGVTTLDWTTGWDRSFSVASP